MWRSTDAVEIADDAWSQNEPTEHQEIAILEIYLVSVPAFCRSEGTRRSVETSVSIMAFPEDRPRMAG